MEEYLQLEKDSDRKHEYLKGEVVRMDGETEQHNAVLANLICEVGSFLKATNGHIFPSAFRTTIPTGQSYFYPDATVVCGDVQMQSGIFDTLINPAVVFEIMSAETKLNDRGYKFFCYNEIPSLKEYILIDSVSRYVEVISREADKAWRFKQFDANAKSFMIDTIGCTVAFDDLYDGVELNETSTANSIHY